MKKLFLFILSLLVLTGSSRAQNRAAVPPGNCEPFTVNLPNLIAHYIFTNGVAGGMVPDISGHGHNAFPSGGALPGMDIAGNPQCAYRFPGDPNSYLRIPSHTDFDFRTQPATISLWYRPEETLPGKYELLAGRGLGLHCPDMSGDYSIGLYDCRKPVGGINLSNCWDAHVWGFSCNDQTGYYHAAGWQHVVVVFDWNAAGTLIVPTHVYWNNISVNTGGTGGCLPPLVPTVNAGDFYIGADFLGFIDEVRVYNTAFAPTEVAALFDYGIMGCCGQDGRPAGIQPTALAAATVRAYPNPVTGQLTVDIPTEYNGGSLSLYNAMGQLVTTRTIGGSSEVVPMQELPAGLYFLECRSGNKRHLQSISKQ